MTAWGIAIAVLAACAAPAPATEGDSGAESGRLGGVDRDPFDRLYRDRYCGEWVICNTSGAACPISEGESALPATCDYDPIAAQECLVEDWGCAGGGSPGFEYPLQPPACLEVCGGY